MKEGIMILIEPPTIRFIGKDGYRNRATLPDDLQRVIQRIAVEVEVDKSFWSEIFPNFKNHQINLILPYYLYENKMLCSDLYNYFSIILAPERLLIFPDIQFILKAHLLNDFKDQILRIAQVELDHYYIHYIDVSSQNVKYQKTKRFDWKDPHSSLQVYKASMEVNSIPIVTDIEHLDRIFEEEFIHLKEKHYIYRIEYGSELTYGMLHRFFYHRAVEFQQNMMTVSESCGVPPIFFVGSFTTSLFFRYYFNNAKPLITYEQYYNVTLDCDFHSLIDCSPNHTSLSVKLFSDEMIAFDIPYGLFSTRHDQQVRSFRMLAAVDMDFTSTLLVLVNGDKNIDYQPSASCLQTLSTLPYFETRMIRWRNIGIAFNIDLCDNIVIDWYHVNKKVFSEIIGKI